MSVIHKFIETMPKAELHLHLEGSLEPQLMFELAARNKINLPYSSVDEIRSAYNFSNLQEFLDIYYAGMSVLKTEEDFYRLTSDYLIKANADNVRHVEVFFDPQGHTTRGIPFETPIKGIHRALTEAGTKFGITFKLIMCFLRHLSEDDAFTTLNQEKPYLHYIDGVGLDSSELGHPPSKFTGVFKAAKQLGLFAVAHAGEEGPPEYIEEAIELLNIDRLDHGNRAMESPALVSKLRLKKIALTVCPLSNLKLCVVSDMSQHPIADMLEQGLLATINSDDPSYFGGYVNDNYKSISDALDLSITQIATLAKNSFEASFLSELEKTKHIATINNLLNSEATLLLPS